MLILLAKCLKLYNIYIDFQVGHCSPDKKDLIWFLVTYRWRGNFSFVLIDIWGKSQEDVYGLWFRPLNIYIQSLYSYD